MHFMEASLVSKVIMYDKSKLIFSNKLVEIYCWAFFLLKSTA